ncbi:MAG: hypothetical protein ACTSUV_03260 [Candidatus Ranarchaeia archaeon]
MRAQMDSQTKGVLLLIIASIAAISITYWFNFLGGKALVNSILFP